MNWLKTIALAERVGKMKKSYQSPDVYFLYVEKTDLIATSGEWNEEQEDVPEEDREYTKLYNL